LHTMFYPNEIRQAAEVTSPNKSEVKKEESQLAMQLIESLAAPFEPEQYRDSYQMELEKLIEAKAKGQKLTVAPRAKQAPVIDLMAALKQSLKSKDAPKKTLLRAVPAKTEKKPRKVG
ncbi:MAG: hypothetical protein WA886_22355, partial [Candidatus Acidiferrales bacterium]